MPIFRLLVITHLGKPFCICGGVCGAGGFIKKRSGIVEEVRLEFSFYLPVAENVPLPLSGKGSLQLLGMRSTACPRPRGRHSRRLGTWVLPF